MSGIADVYGDLRRMVAGQLGYDMEKLTPAQGAKLDTVVGLRLEADRIATAQLRGEPIDPKQLLMVGEALESALRPAQLAANGGPRDAREKLRELLDNMARAREEEQAAHLADVMRREEAIQAAEAAGESPEEAASPVSQGGEAASASVVSFPGGRPPHRSAASEASSLPCAIPAPKGRPEGYRVGPGTEPWRGWVTPL
jgi:hypothetical protein